MAKGAAMLAPNMATMLAVLTTDAAVEPRACSRCCATRRGRHLQRLTVDGCTSTNDTVIVLASGAAGPADPDALRAAVAEACLDLADADGRRRRGRHQGRAGPRQRRGQRRRGPRRRPARSPRASSCKCSWYGEDPYWGRIASELGGAGIAFDPTGCRSPTAASSVADDGVAVDHDAAAVAAHMAGRDIEITADLGLGDGEATVLTNDLTHAYIDENMGTS